MYATQIAVRATSDEVATLLALTDRWAADTATSPLNDHLRLALSGAAESDAALVVTMTSTATNTATTSADGPDPTPVAYAVAAPGAGGMICERYADPSVGDTAQLAAEIMITTAQASWASQSPFRESAEAGLIWWVDGDIADPDLLSPWTLTIDRRLYEMRRHQADPPVEPLASVPTRSFVPGTDDDAWIAVNNRAFAGHPEQAQWDRATLDQRLAEPWFDPDGFRLYELDGQLAAFCWTKIHRDREPTAGEIYVIAVDPAYHGRGLGRELTLAGLDAIAAQGVADTILYVDAENEPAVNLYDSLNFEVDRVRTAYRMHQPVS